MSVYLCVCGGLMGGCKIESIVRVGILQKNQSFLTATNSTIDERISFTISYNTFKNCPLYCF